MYLFISLRKYHIKVRLFQNFSFGTTTLDLIEKTGFRPLFRKPVQKLARVLEQAHVRLLFPVKWRRLMAGMKRKGWILMLL
jgi:hypothetical protein